MVSLDSPVDSIPKISKKILPALKRLGIKTIRDLLFHFPQRYDDFSNEKQIAEVTAGEVVTIKGVIDKIHNIRTFRKRMVITEATISDESGSIKALWFNQSFLIKNLRQGLAFNFSGKISLGKRGIYLQNPAYEKIQSPNGEIQNSQGIHTGGLVAVYPETRGITSKWLRFLVNNLIGLSRTLVDPLPKETRDRHKLPETKDALLKIHFPKNREEARDSEHRFQFEELLLNQLLVLQNRVNLGTCRAPEIPADVNFLKKFVQSLPFPLTDAQRRSLWEIAKDMEKGRPMNRLLEGDVGSGKTVVAAAAAYLAVKAGFGVAFMAPTEILARQHYETLNKILDQLGVATGLMVGSEKNASAYDSVVVGTHALIQKDIYFEKLGLVVVDEQHRFGVEQRAALLKNQESGRKNKNEALVPHFLSMSATPIPRTLALTIYGDLDLSIIDEMPKSRKHIITKVVESSRRHEIYLFIREEVKHGRQVFVICPRIDLPENDDFKISQQKMLQADLKAVKEEYKKLSENIFPDLRIAMLHGKMKAKEKDETMKKFKKHQFDILVSTSVVEVGVDVSNATIMVIEGAERFGLAQLHQFRGRVGRGSEQSYCFLFPTEDGVISRRLKALEEAKSGFELAEKDLEIRGPGDFLGTRQSGIPGALAQALANPVLVRDVRKEAAEILSKDPWLVRAPVLKQKVADMKKVLHPE